MEYYLFIKKQQNHAICKKMDGTGDHFIKEYKPDPE
jgi:hypothetical protein